MTSKQTYPYNIIAVIQSRIASTRLPGKALIDLQGKTITEHVINIAKSAAVFDKIILALPNNSADDKLERRLSATNITITRGDEHNVLQRYTDILKKFEAPHVCRLTGDNPLLDPQIIKKVVKQHFKNNADYTSNKMTNSYPTGMDVEVVKSSALISAINNNPTEEEKEHVTLHIRKRDDKYKCHKVYNSDDYTKKPNLRLTLDTKEDLTLIKKIYNELYKNEPIKLKDVMRYLNKNPGVKKINENIKQTSLKGFQ